MPIQIDQHLIDDLMKRQVDHDTVERTNNPSTSDSRELNPSLLLLLGAVADGASTTNFMRKGVTEDDTLYRPLRNSPLATGLAVAGTGIATTVAHKLLAKKFPLIARVLLANQAGERIGLAAQNFSQSDHLKESGINTYNKSVTQAIRRSPGK